MMRKLSVLTLAGFMIGTGIYVFIYLARSFQPNSAGGRELVGIWHGDNFSRTILVAIFFLIGEVFAIYLALNYRKRSHTLNVRDDVWRWLSGRASLTGESSDFIAERAISMYRMRLEGGPEGIPSVPELR